MKSNTEGKKCRTAADFLRILTMVLTVVFLSAVGLTGEARAAYDVTIVSTGSSSNGSWAGNTWTASADNSTVLASEVQTHLANGPTVISTGSGGTQKGDILVSAGIAWSANRLTLSAANDININAALTGTGSVALALEYGQGAVALGNSALYRINTPVKFNAFPKDPTIMHMITKRGSDGVPVERAVPACSGRPGGCPFLKNSPATLDIEYKSTEVNAVADSAHWIYLDWRNDFVTYFPYVMGCVQGEGTFYYPRNQEQKNYFDTTGTITDLAGLELVTTTTRLCRAFNDGPILSLLSYQDFPYGYYVKFVPLPGECGNEYNQLSVLVTAAAEANTGYKVYDYILNERPTLTVTKAGAGTGRVVDGPHSDRFIYCGTDCSADYAYGTTRELYVNPSPGSVFGGWSNGTGSAAGCTGTGTCTVTLTEISAVTANFLFPQTISVTQHVPSIASAGSTFDVAASASSGLPVSITTSGSCSGSGTGSAVITMAAGVGICTVHFSQAGDGTTYAPVEATEDAATGACSVTVGSSASSGGSWVGNTWMPSVDGSTVAAAEVEAHLASGPTVISTVCGSANKGGIVVDADITWSANALTLRAGHDITVNSALTGSGTAALALEYGQGELVAGNTAVYRFNIPVKLKSHETDPYHTPNFSTRRGSDGVVAERVVPLCPVEGRDQTITYGCKFLPKTLTTPLDIEYHTREVDGFADSDIWVYVNENDRFTDVYYPYVMSCVEGVGKFYYPNSEEQELYFDASGAITDFSNLNAFTTTTKKCQTWDWGPVYQLFSSSVFDHGYYIKFVPLPGETGKAYNVLSTVMVDEMNANTAYKVIDYIVNVLPNHNLSVTKTGAGTGIVTSSPAGIDCGGTCSADFHEGTDVTLYAMPDPDSTFSGWSGDCDASGRVTMSAPKACAAKFRANQTITVTQPAPATAAYNSTFDISATASSGLLVDITTSGPCSGSGTATATITMTSWTGTCTVHYNQAGDTNFAPAPEVTEDTVAIKINQTITVTQRPPADAFTGSGFIVSAASGSGLPVSITTSGACSGSGTGTTTIYAATGGTCTVYFNQAGDANYNAAPEVTETTSIAVNGTNFPPVGRNLSAAGNEGAVCIDIPMSMYVSDPNGDSVSLVLDSMPVSGTLYTELPPDYISALGYCYHPNKTFFHGSDSFTYHVVDSQGAVSPTYQGTICVADIGSGGGAATSSVSLPIASSASSYFGQLVTFTVTVTLSDSALPTEDVFFLDGAVVMGSASPIGNTVSFTTSALSAGSHNITAFYPGDCSDAHLSSTSAELTHTVNKAAQTITVTQSAPLNAAYNTTFDVSATASSGLDVSITTSGVCSGSGTNTATITMTSGTGTCTVHYNQAGDSNYNPAPEVTEDTTAQKVDQTALILNAGTPLTYNTSETLSTTGGSGTGGVTYQVTSGSCTVVGDQLTANSGTGSCSITATRAADVSYNEATAAATVILQKADTVTTITSDTPDPSSEGDSYTVTFTVTAAGGTPTGNVTVTEGVKSCIADVAAGNCDLKSTTAGTKALTVTYSGDADYNGSASAPVSHTVRNDTYTVTPSAGQGGSISPSTPQTVTEGGTITFAVIPDAGYHIASVTGCAGELTGGTYTTGPVTANCSVTAVFSMDFACPDPGNPCIERADGGDDSNNLVGGNPNSELEYIFRIIVTDTSGTPPSVILMMTRSGGPSAEDWYSYEMSCTGDFAAGAVCTFTTKLGPASLLNCYYLVRRSDGTEVTYPSSGFITGPQIELMNGYNMLGVPKDLSGAALDGQTAFGTDLTFRWRSEGLTLLSNDGSFIPVDITAPVRTGEGYLVKRETRASMPELGEYPEITAPDYSITLSAGWNIISNPYSGNALLRNTLLRKGSEEPIPWMEAAGRNWVVNALYHYSGDDFGGTYSFESAGGLPDAALVPWLGYWMYLGAADDSYTLIIPEP